MPGRGSSLKSPDPALLAQGANRLGLAGREFPQGARTSSACNLRAKCLRGGLPGDPSFQGFQPRRFRRVTRSAPPQALHSLLKRESFRGAPQLMHLFFRNIRILYRSLRSTFSLVSVPMTRIYVTRVNCVKHKITVHWNHPRAGGVLLRFSRPYLSASYTRPAGLEFSLTRHLSYARLDSSWRRSPSTSTLRQDRAQT